MAPMQEWIDKDEHEHQDRDHDPSAQTRLASAHDETQRERDDDDGDQHRRDDRRKADRREIDARHAKHAAEHERRAETRGHREQSTKTLALAGLLAAIAPWNEGIQTREERGAERRREDHTGRRRIRRDRVEAERCAAEPRDQERGYDESLNTAREISGDARDRRRR